MPPVVPPFFPDRTYDIQTGPRSTSVVTGLEAIELSTGGSTTVVSGVVTTVVQTA
jgi:hypothetical protein